MLAMNLPAALQVGQSGIEVKVRRNAQARRLVLRVSVATGEVTLTVPHGVKRPEAEHFVITQEAWLHRQIARLEPKLVVQPGDQIPIEGRMVLIAPGLGRIRRESDQLILGGRVTSTGSRLKAYLKNLARERLVHETQMYAGQISRPFGRISLRDTRSRWGSCSAQGNLMYSWRLVMAPPEVLSYVAAHEVAHLVEMNHSNAFWDQLGLLMPSYENPRGWLKTHGAELHKYRF